MFYLRLALLIAVFSSISSEYPAIGQEPADALRCKNQLIYPNADLDNYESPPTGNIKLIVEQETDLEDGLKSDIVASVVFNERGQIVESFLTRAKTKNFGKKIYNYDRDQRLSLVVDYNPDGSSVMEDIFTYDASGNLVKVVTRWTQTKKVAWNKEFSYNAETGISELFDKSHNYGFKFRKDKRCRLTEVSSFKSDRKTNSVVRVIYDDIKNIAEESVFSNSGDLVGMRRYEFEYDKKGNWISKKSYQLTVENGRAVYVPIRVVEREITYFDTN